MFEIKKQKKESRRKKTIRKIESKIKIPVVLFLRDYFRQIHTF